jgi:prepilin-type N-terminal cleavage/methylation domain-containing protein
MEEKGKKYLKGFTLIEIIITMLISSILIGVAIRFIFLLFTIGSQSSKEELRSDKVLFTYGILSSVSIRATSIIKASENQIEFTGDQGAITTVDFIPSTIILKQESVVDSVKIDWNNLNISMVDSTSKLINKFSLNIGSGLIDYPIVINKEYSLKMLYELRNE